MAEAGLKKSKLSRKAAVKQKAEKQKTVASKTVKQQDNQSITLGDYAHEVFAKQYRRLVKQEAGVLQDTDPECLHQMRVATRRLRTALQVFGSAVDLPKAAQEKQVQALTKVLGELRDLDVQMAVLQDEYHAQVPPDEQKQLEQAVDRLHKQRNRVFAKVKSTLTQSKYADLKAAYEDWLDHPKYTALAELPLTAVLPDLLSPLLSKLLMHPGWLVAAQDQSSDGGEVLHELRKACKQVRYQAEFFSHLYGAAFQDWVAEIRQLQENLGVLQDTHVLMDILAEQANLEVDLPTLNQAIHKQQLDALADWDRLRAQYTDAKFRYSLHQMILSPN